MNCNGDHEIPWIYLDRNSLAVAGTVVRNGNALLLVPVKVPTVVLRNPGGSILPKCGCSIVSSSAALEM